MAHTTLSLLGSPLVRFETIRFALYYPTSGPHHSFCPRTADVYRHSTTLLPTHIPPFAPLMYIDTLLHYSLTDTIPFFVAPCATGGGTRRCGTSRPCCFWTRGTKSASFAASTICTSTTTSSSRRPASDNCYAGLSFDGGDMLVFSRPHMFSFFFSLSLSAVVSNDSYCALVGGIAASLRILSFRPAFSPVPIFHLPSCGCEIMSSQFCAVIGMVCETQRRPMAPHLRMPVSLPLLVP